MTDTPHPLAALLRDVPRYACTNAGDMEDDPFGKFLFRNDVLAALTAAMDPALAERAGEVLEGVMPYDGDPCGCAYCADNPATLWRNGDALCSECQDRQEAALVPALLAQIAALRAEVRKSAMDAVSAGCQAQEAWEAQKAAEAVAEKLRGALAFYADDFSWRMNGPLDPNSHNFTGGPARAALTTEADNDRQA